ncbi:MAG: hypothetical protein KKD33_07230, partial [Verrucomicrobia bacterium]|nr:hypothetical protein [Verrucomicrobiota bacterium]
GADEKTVLTGKAALKFELPEQGGVSLRSKPVAVAGGGLYLFSAAYRSEGFGKPGAYSGVSASMNVEWLDVTGKGVGRAGALAFPYHAMDWDLRDFFARAPPAAAQAVVTMAFNNQSLEVSGKNIPSVLWLDAVQLREYNPPPTPDWAKKKAELFVDGFAPETQVKTFFPASDPAWHSKNGQWSKSITDKKAERGGALKAVACGSSGIMGHSPYFPALPPGLYRIIAKIAVRENTSDAKAGYIDIDSSRAAGRTFIDIIPKEFTTPDEYMEIRKDFIIRDDGWWDIRLFTEGKQEWRVDSIRVFPLYVFSDLELISVYPGCEGSVPAELKPVKKPVINYLVVAGIGWDTFKIQDILRLTALDIKIKPVWLATLQAGYRLKGWPENPKELFENNVIVLCNIPSTAFSIRQKNILKEFVRRGGVIMIFGGHRSCERSSWKGSLLDEIFPVEIASSIGKGLVSDRKGIPIRISEKLPWLPDYKMDSIPAVYFLHRTVAKKDSEILAYAGDLPFLCVRKFGAGRVICCTGMPNGISGDLGVPFWQWNDWIYLMRDAVNYAVKK